MLLRISLRSSRAPLRAFASAASSSAPHRYAAAAAAAAAAVASATAFSVLSAPAPTVCEDSDACALSKKEFREFTVSQTTRVSPDTSLIRVALPTAEHTLGLVVASCLSISAEIDGEVVSRPYTPISTTEQRGTADFIIKQVRPGSTRLCVRACVGTCAVCVRYVCACVRCITRAVR